MTFSGMNSLRHAAKETVKTQLKISKPYFYSHCPSLVLEVDQQGKAKPLNIDPYKLEPDIETDK
eukprot:Pgem_evm1s12353